LLAKEDGVGAGKPLTSTGIFLDYRQTFFSLNTNTEEMFHFARRIKLSTHFTRFTYISFASRLPNKRGKTRLST
jgi:hypothetical protein